jgi:hypothetical protein
MPDVLHVHHVGPAIWRHSVGYGRSDGDQCRNYI